MKSVHFYDAYTDPEDSLLDEALQLVSGKPYALAGFHIKQFLEPQFLKNAFVIILRSGMSSSQGKPVAIAFWRKVLNAAELDFMAVSEDMRGQGLGKEIMLFSEQYFSLRGFTDLTLEVSVKNVFALRIYTALGFKKIGFRKNYYSNIEDALVMGKEISPICLLG